MLIAPRIADAASGASVLSVVEALRAQVAEVLPEVPVHAAVLRDNPAEARHEDGIVDVLDLQHEPGVVVPLTLSTDYRVAPAIAAAIERVSTQRRLTHYLAPALGPHEWLDLALRDGLAQKGAQHGDGIVVAIPAALHVADATALSLARTLGGGVTTAPLSPDGEAIRHAVARLRAEGRTRVFLAPYLLFPGREEENLRRLGRECGVNACADAIGASSRVVELITARYTVERHVLASRRPPTRGRVAPTRESALSTP